MNRGRINKYFFFIEFFSGVIARAGGLETTGISKNKDMFTFSPKKGPDMDIGQFKGKKYPLMVIFENLSDADKELVKNPTILYYKTWMEGADLSCYVDRYEDFPINFTPGFNY